MLNLIKIKYGWLLSVPNELFFTLYNNNIKLMKVDATSAIYFLSLITLHFFYSDLHVSDVGLRIC